MKQAVVPQLGASPISMALKDVTGTPLERAAALVSSGVLQHYKESELVKSLRDITVAMENGEAKRLGWSEDLVLAALDHILEKLPSERYASACEQQLSSLGPNEVESKLGISPTATEVEQTEKIGESQECLRAALNAQRHKLDQDLNAEADRSEHETSPWVKRLSDFLDRVRLPYLGSLKCVIRRCLPEGMRMALADVGPVSSSVNWGKGFTPRDQFVGQVDDPSERFLAIQPVLRSYVYHAESQKKIEVSTYLRKQGHKELEERLWRLETLAGTTECRLEASCELPISSNFTTFPLAPQFKLVSACFLDRAGRKLDEPVQVATNILGGFRLLNVPGKARRIRYDVADNSVSSIPSDLADQLKKVLPNSSTVIEMEKHFLECLNRMKVSPDARVSLQIQHFAAQNFMYVNSKVLGAAYGQLGTKAFAFMQGLKMGLCDSISCFQYQHLNNLEGVTALLTSVLTVDSARRFQVAPGHITNQVLTRSSCRQVDFTEFMARVELKESSLGFHGLDIFSAEELVKMGRIIVRGIIMEQAIHIKAGEQERLEINSVLLKESASLNKENATTLTACALAENLRQYAARHYVVDVLRPKLESLPLSQMRSLDLVEILLELKDLAISLDRDSLTAALPHLHDIPDLTPFAHLLKQVLVGETAYAIQRGDQLLPAVIWDWTNAQLCSEPVCPGSTAKYGHFEHYSEFGLDLETVSEIVALYRNIEGLNPESVISLIDRYAKLIANRDRALSLDCCNGTATLGLLAGSVDSYDQLAHIYLAVLQNFAQALNFDSTNFLNCRQLCLNLIPMMLLEPDRTALGFCKFLPVMSAESCARAHRWINQGSTARFDLLLADHLVVAVPDAILKIIEHGGGQREILHFMGAVLQFGLGPSVSELQAQYTQLCQHLFSTNMGLPPSPGPAQRLVHTLSGAFEVTNLLENLHKLNAIPAPDTIVGKAASIPEMSACTFLLAGIQFRYSMYQPSSFSCSLPIYSCDFQVPIDGLNIFSIFNSTSMTLLLTLAGGIGHRFDLDLLLEDPLAMQIGDFFESHTDSLMKFVNLHEARNGEGIVELEKLSSFDAGTSFVNSKIHFKAAVLLSVLQNSGVSPTKLLQCMLNPNGYVSAAMGSTSADKIAVLLLHVLKEEGAWVSEALSLYLKLDADFIEQKFKGAVQENSDAIRSLLQPVTVSKFHSDKPLAEDFQAGLLERIPAQDLTFWSDVVDECWQLASKWNSYRQRYSKSRSLVDATSVFFQIEKAATTGDFDKHMPYTQGSDIRQVDWKVFGRSDRLVVKNHIEDGRARVHLAVDMHDLIEDVELLFMARKLGDQALVNHSVRPLMDLFAQIQLLDAERGKLLKHQLTLANAVGVRSFDLLPSNHSRLRAAFAEHLALSKNYSVWAACTPPCLFDENILPRQINSNSMLVIYSGKEALENSNKAIELFRKRGATLIINGRKA
jgi:hypothetical protein